MSKEIRGDGQLLYSLPEKAWTDAFGHEGLTVYDPLNDGRFGCVSNFVCLVDLIKRSKNACGKKRITKKEDVGVTKLVKQCNKWLRVEEEVNHLAED